MTDEAALLVAIHHSPEDDTPRLAYADYLDDHPTTVACRACKGKGEYSYRTRIAEMDRDDEGGVSSGRCGVCHGSGWVSDGRAERAEFIRVQVELARTPEAIRGPVGDAYPNGRYTELRRRERELFLRYAGTWFGGRYYVKCTVTLDETGSFPAHQAGNWLTIRRGFATAHLSLAALMGGECEGTGRTPGLAARLGGVVGLTGVRIVGAEPHDSSFSPRWNWFDDDGGRVVQPEAIPGPIFDLLPGEPVPQSRLPRSHKSFDSRAAALSALDAAALAYCRAEAAKSPAAG